MNYRGLGVTQDYAEAAKWYRRAAEQGNAPSQIPLGSMYLQGQGVLQDYTEALKWFRLAAEHGDAFAQWSTGRFYHRGIGVAQNYVQAHKWLSLAKEGGNADARDDLRDVVAKMTPEQIEEAQRLAGEWRQTED
jgi:TPR repeat protein